MAPSGLRATTTACRDGGLPNAVATLRRRPRRCVRRNRPPTRCSGRPADIPKRGRAVRHWTARPTPVSEDPNVQLLRGPGSSRKRRRAAARSGYHSAQRCRPAQSNAATAFVAVQRGNVGEAACTQQAGHARLSGGRRAGSQRCQQQEQDACFALVMPGNPCFRHQRPPDRAPRRRLTAASRGAQQRRGARPGERAPAAQRNAISWMRISLPVEASGTKAMRGLMRM